MGSAFSSASVTKVNKYSVPGVKLERYNEVAGMSPELEPPDHSNKKLRVTHPPGLHPSVTMVRRASATVSLTMVTPSVPDHEAQMPWLGVTLPKRQSASTAYNAVNVRACMGKWCKGVGARGQRKGKRERRGVQERV